MTDPRRYAPAAARNRDAILGALRRLLPPAGLVLEVASGSGEHAVHLARALPALVFQPSDPDPGARASTNAHAAAAGLPNLRPALALDVTAAAWPVAAADAVFSANMIHIAPWAATLGLLAGAARVLAPGAPLLIYGPFLRADAPTAPGNLRFDAELRARDPAWGLRTVEAVTAAAAGFARPEVVPMPANNLILVFRRAGAPVRDRGGPGQDPRPAATGPAAVAPAGARAPAGAAGGRIGADGGAGAARPPHPWPDAGPGARGQGRGQGRGPGMGQGGEGDAEWPAPGRRNTCRAMGKSPASPQISGE